MKTAVTLLIIILSTSGGDVLIAKGLKLEREISASGLRGFLLQGRKVLTNKNFLMGLFFMSVSFFSFLAILSWADLSFTIPATSLSYVFSTVGAKYVLRERISPLRWTGTLFVCLGIALVSLP
jgi:drug/metabolite transporter (DMT)-like permease